jgi:hypothetical protein
LGILVIVKRGSNTEKQGVGVRFPAGKHFLVPTFLKEEIFDATVE